MPPSTAFSTRSAAVPAGSGGASGEGVGVAVVILRWSCAGALEGRVRRRPSNVPDQQGTGSFVRSGLDGWAPTDVLRARSGALFLEPPNAKGTRKDRER